MRGARQGDALARVALKAGDATASLAGAEALATASERAPSGGGAGEPAARRGDRRLHHRRDAAACVRARWRRHAVAARAATEC
eukprot:3163467-Prymnesium_polylepis.1